MKIRRFKGKNIRDALQKVRAELGPDAVILSNNATANGVDILAASDTDWPDTVVKNDTLGVNSDDNLADLLDAAPQAAPSAGNAANPFAAYQAQANAGRKSASPEPDAPRDQATRLRERANEMFGRGFQDPHNRAPNAPKTGGIPLNRVASADRPAGDDDDLRQELRSLRSLVERQLGGLAWGELGRNQPHRAELLQKLHDFGLRPQVCEALADSTHGETFKDAWKEAMALLIQKLPTARTNVLEHGGVIGLVGPTGVGKTTTVAKLAGQFTLRHGPGSVALITADGHRIGTQEQLRAFGRILDIPVAYAADHNELREYLKRFANYKLVIVDSSGISHRDPRLAAHMGLFHDLGREIETYLVMAANTQPKSLEQAANAFARYGVAGAIVTKIDEADSLGGVIGALAQAQMPLAFTTNGQEVPDDLAVGNPVELVRHGITLLRETPEPEGHERHGLAFGPLAAARYA